MTPLIQTPTLRATAAKAMLALTLASATTLASADVLLGSTFTTFSGVALAPDYFTSGLQFTTGSEPAGYTLHTLDVRLFDATPGTQTDTLSVVLMSDDFTPLQTLSFAATVVGNSASTADTVSMSLGDWALEKGTKYYLVFYGPTSLQIAVGSQQRTGQTNAVKLASGWTTGASVFEKANDNLRYLNPTLPPFFAKYPAVTLSGALATAVPEPGALSLSLAGLLTLGLSRRTRRAVSSQG